MLSRIKKAVALLLVALSAFFMSTPALAIFIARETDDESTQVNCGGYIIYEEIEYMGDCDYPAVEMTEDVIYEYRYSDELMITTNAVPPTVHCAEYSLTLVETTVIWKGMSSSHHRLETTYKWKCNRAGCEGGIVGTEVGPNIARETDDESTQVDCGGYIIYEEIEYMGDCDYPAVEMTEDVIYEYRYSDELMITTNAVPPSVHCAGYSLTLVETTVIWKGMSSSHHRLETTYKWKCNRAGCGGGLVGTEVGPNVEHSFVFLSDGGHNAVAKTHSVDHKCTVCKHIRTTTYPCTGTPCILPQWLPVDLSCCVG